MALAAISLSFVLPADLLRMCCPINQSRNYDLEKDWPPAQGYSAIHSCPRGLHAIDNLLGPSVQPVFSPPHGPVVCQYYDRIKMTIGDTMAVFKDFPSQDRQYPLLSPCPLNWSPHQRGSPVGILKNLQMISS